MPGGTRREYLDWLRGVAVLVMIASHLLESWTGGPDRSTRAFAWAMIVAGFGAPLFLFLAGAAVPLSAGSKARRSGDVMSASRAIVWRGLQIYGLAFLFRIQAWILGWSSPRALLKVDILNIMGPSIAVAGALWGAAKSVKARIVVFASITVAITLATPLIRITPLDGLPDPLEAYLRPVAGLTNFAFFPSAGYLFAGVIPGVLLDNTSGRRERSIVVWLFIAGVAAAGAALALSYLPSPYPRSDFWTTSPSYFFVVTGLMTAAVGAAYAWESRPGGIIRWSPLRQLGRSSLFVYWIHVEMVYGLISRGLHKALTLPQALAAFVLFALFMLACSIAKDRAVSWWRARALNSPAAQPSDRPGPHAGQARHRPRREQ